MAARSLRIVHAVSTVAFAGVERSILLSASALAERGHGVVVIGGDETTMRASLDPIGVPWRPAASTLGVARALWKVGRVDIVHAHMTAAELGAVLTRGRNGGRLVVTRHFAKTRGATPAGRAASVLIGRVPHTEIAISRYVERAIGAPSHLVHHGVLDREAVDGCGKRVVVIQRLEAEKDTALALRAWACSGLGEEGWELVIAGDGADRPALEALAHSEGVCDSVRFLGYVKDVDAVRALASVQLATASIDAFGLSVLEAMSVGLAVLAADGGAHRELLGDRHSDALFRPGDAEDAGLKLRRLASDLELRRALGKALWLRQRERFSLAAHAQALERAYIHAIDRPRLKSASSG